MEALSSKSLIKDTPISVATFDNELRFINHSGVWLQVCGIKEKDVVGKRYYDVIPNTPNELKKIHRACLKGKSDVTERPKFVGTDGTIQWLRWIINPWRNNDGIVGGIIVIIENITERKRMEELLLGVQSVTKIGGWEVDLVCNKVHWTAITKEIHEVAEDYVPHLEAVINFFKQGEDREKIAMMVSECISDGKPWDTELKIVTAKGREIWVRSKGEVEMVNKKCTRIFGVFQDIDEQKKAELEFQEITGRFAIATQAANVGIWEYNIVENSLFWDDNMYQLYGINEDDFSGVYEAWEASVHPDDQARCQKEIEMAISGEKEFKTEFRVIWPNNEIHHIKAESVVQMDETGRPLKMIGTNWDITSAKKAEKELKALLKITNEQNNSLLNFAHIVSHNLRSHSSNISMLTGYLNKEATGEMRKSLLQMLNKTTDSLNETVLDLNEVVQVKTNVIEKFDSINLYTAIKNIENNISVLLKDQTVKYHIDIPETLNIKVVPAFLDSILINLFTNSIRYSDPDRKPIIKISSKNQGNRTILYFNDNGLGIDLDRYGEKIFGMYKTFHAHKDAKGFGLYITKSQMETMKGKIEVESTVGVGTTFILYFNKQ